MNDKNEMIMKMLNMMMRDNNNDNDIDYSTDLTPELNKRYTSVGVNTWETPFGVSFTLNSNLGWLCIYHDKGTSLIHYNPNTMKIKDVHGNVRAHCIITSAEILDMIQIFDKHKDDELLFDPFTKPKSITELESQFCGKAYLHFMYAFRWVFETKHFSCINNPFNLRHVIYSSSEYNFEVLFNTNDDIHDYISVDDIIRLATEKEFIIDKYKCSLCNKRSPIELKRCVKCKKAYYCDNQCQATDWKKGRNNHKRYCT